MSVSYFVVLLWSLWWLFLVLKRKWTFLFNKRPKRLPIVMSLSSKCSLGSLFLASLVVISLRLNCWVLFPTPRIFTIDACWAVSLQTSVQPAVLTVTNVSWRKIRSRCDGGISVHVHLLLFDALWLPIQCSCKICLTFRCHIVHHVVTLPKQTKEIWIFASFRWHPRSLSCEKKLLVFTCF